MLVMRQRSTSAQPRRCRTDRSRAGPSSRPAPPARAGGCRRRATAAQPPARHRLRRARHQVAEVVRHHERHLPVGEHGGLGRPVVPEVKKNQHGSSCSTDARPRLRRWRLDEGVVVLAEVREPDRDTKRMSGARRGGRVLREVAVADHAEAPLAWPDRPPRPGSAGSSSAPRRRRAGSRRTSTRTSGCSSWTAPGRGRPSFTPRGKGCRHGVDAAVELGPGPGRVAPHEADLVPPGSRLLEEHRAELALDALHFDLMPPCESGSLGVHANIDRRDAEAHPPPGRQEA